MHGSHGAAGVRDNQQMIALLASLLSAMLSLAGVYLGAHLTARTQRRLADQTRILDDKRRRELAYADLLAAYRRYRVFVSTEALAVELVGGTPVGGGVPIVQVSFHLKPR